MCVCERETDRQTGTTGQSCRGWLHRLLFFHESCDWLLVYLSYYLFSSVTSCSYFFGVFKKKFFKVITIEMLCFPCIGRGWGTHSYIQSEGVLVALSVLLPQRLWELHRLRVLSI